MPTGEVGRTGNSQRLEFGEHVNSQWWRTFQCKALDDLVSRSLKNSPSVESARAALRQAHELTAAQSSAALPSVQAGYNVSRQLNPVGTIAPTLASGQALYTLHTTQLSVGYTADVFGLNRRLVESLQAQEDMQRFQLDAAQFTLVSNLVVAVVNDASLRAQIEATRQNIVAAQHALSITREQLSHGYATGLDVATQESLLAQVRQGLPPLIKQLEQTRDLIAALSGDPPTSLELVACDLDSLQLPATIPVAVPAALVNQRADIRAAEEQVHLASAQVGVAVANRLPQVSITALLGGSATMFSQMFADSNKFWAIGGSVGQTLFDFGDLAHHEYAARANLDEATALYRAAVISAFQNVADSLYALSNDSDSLVAATDSESATQKTLALTQSQLDHGAINRLVLLSAEQSFWQSRLVRIQAQASRLADTAALFQALGGPWDNSAANP